MEYENCTIQNRQDTERMHALIKQLGEALGEAFVLMNPQLDHIGEALNAYNNYLRERGE